MTRRPTAQARAAEALAALLAQAPDRRPDAAAEAAMLDWAVAGLGSDRFLPALRLWTAVHGGFARGWLPDSYLARSVLPGLQGAAGRRLGASRTLMRRILGSDLLPDRAFRVRGFWLDRNGRPMAGERVEKTLFGRQPSLLLRRDGAPRGQALIRVDRVCFARETSRPGDLTVLAPAAQDRALADLAPVATGGGLALLRVLTVKTAGAAARAPGSLLRLPMGEEPLPRPGAEIALGIDPATGRIKGPGLAPGWRPIAAHPDTGQLFEGLALPGHAAALAACCELHDRVPHLTLIAWEVLLTQGGKAQILDWELAAPETAALQALCGPVLAGLGWEDHWRDPAPEPAPPEPAMAAPPPARRPALALVPPSEPASGRPGEPASGRPGEPDTAPPETGPAAESGTAATAAVDPAEKPAEAPLPPVRPRRVTLPQALRRRA